MEVFNGLKWFSLVVEGFSTQKNWCPNCGILLVFILFCLYCLLCLANLFGVSVQFACTKRDDENILWPFVYINWFLFFLNKWYCWEKRNQFTVWCEYFCVNYMERYSSTMINFQFRIIRCWRLEERFFFFFNKKIYK